MIYCLSGSQDKEYLLKADEVNIPYSKLHYVAELLRLREGQVRVVITLDVPDINWDELHTTYTACEHCQVAINTMQDLVQCHLHGIDKYFFSFPIRDFYTLNYYITLGICAARIAPPLTHCLNDMATYEIEIRATVNSSNALNPDDPKSDGIIGGWFRPEDMNSEFFTSAVQVVEFDAENIEQEQALWRIYTKGEWPGELHYIIPSVHDNDVLNRALPPEFGERRANCRQRCEQGAHSTRCRYCRIISSFARLDTMKKIKALTANPSGE